MDMHLFCIFVEDFKKKMFFLKNIILINDYSGPWPRPVQTGPGQSGNNTTPSPRKYRYFSVLAGIYLPWLKNLEIKGILIDNLLYCQWLDSHGSYQKESVFYLPPKK